MARELGPVSNPRFLDVMAMPVLSSADCDAVIASTDPTAWRSARVASDDAYGAIEPNVRSVLSQPLQVRSDGWPIREIVSTVAEANAATWRYDLWGFAGSDHPSVLLYEGQVNDHFRPHLDVGEHAPTRKLSFSLQLSPSDSYRGGDLLLGGKPVEQGRNQGVMTVFPSVVTHEVTPVFAGRRLAIVGWVHGPTFR